MFDIVTHLTPVVGIDVHTVFIPPSPTPVPIPHPHVGAVLDFRELANAVCPDIVQAMDHVSAQLGPLQQAASIVQNPKAALIGMASSAIGGAVANVICGAPEAGNNAPVKAHGLLRGTVGTHSFHVPGLHFPLGAGFGPPDPLPSQDAGSFMGSKTVSVNGDPLSYMALPSLSCWFQGMPPSGGNSPHMNRSHKSLPTAVQLPIPFGKRVVVGGMPVPNWHAIVAALATAVASKAIDAAASAAQKKIEERSSQKKNEQNTTDKQGCGDPINLVTGEVVVYQCDFVVSGRVPLVWERSYGGQYGTCGCLGHNWENVADTRIEVIKENNQIVLVVNFSDYETVFDGFPLEEGWNHRIYDGQNGHAIYLKDNYLILRTNEQLEYFFPVRRETLESDLLALSQDNAIRYSLSQMLDRHANGWVFERDENSLLTTLNEVCVNQLTARYITCTHRKNQAGEVYLKKLVLCSREDNRFQHLLIDYDYDDYGNLICATDGNNHPYRYAYTQDHLMLAHTNRNGFTYRYNYEKGIDDVKRVVSAQAEDGSYHYQMIYHRDKQETISINSLGHQRTLQYDNRNLPIANIDELGGVTTYEYDGICRLIAEVDHCGHRTEWIYNGRGNIVETRYPDKTKISSVFDDDGLRVAVKDQASHLWQQVFNQYGQIIKRIMPLSEKAYEYNSKGELVNIIDAENQSTLLDYDTWGFVGSVTDPQGNKTQLVRDIHGNVTEKIAPNDDKTVYQYDNVGRLVSQVSPDKKNIKCLYDGEGNLIRYLENGKKEQRFSYWAFNKLVRKTLPDESEIGFHYDTEGRLIGVENQKREIWQIKRDALHRITEEIDYWGKSRHYRYNASGYLEGGTDPLGNQLAFATDALGRIIAKIANHDPATEEKYGYDKRGLLVSATNQNARVKREYNSGGFLVKETQYTSAGTGELFYDYTLRNKLSRHEVVFTPQNASHTRFNQVINYDYNANGELIRQQVDDHQPIEFGYDNLGRLTHQTLNDKLVQEFNYTQNHQLARQRMYHDNDVVDAISYQYDEFGQLTERHDAHFGIDRYLYDPLGQILEHIDPMQHIDRFVYDSAGNRYTEVSQNEQERVVAFGEGRFYHFDPAGQLTKRRHDKQPTQKLHWNAWGKLIGVDEHTTYTYDALGRRIGKVCRQNGKTKISCFVWNVNALSAEVELKETTLNATFFGYYPWSFVPLTLQTKAPESDGIVETGYYFYQNEFNGAPIRLRNETGEIVWAVHYNALGQAKIIKDATVRQPLRLQGQYFDDETGLHYNRHRYYDPAVGMFISQDPIGLLGGINVYQFAPNTIHWVDPLGLRESNVTFPKEQVHPSTVTADHPDGVYTIQATGSRHGDKVALYGEAKLKESFSGSWISHHISYDPETNEMKMQLVSAEPHSKKGHDGGVKEFEDDTKLKYESDEAKAEAKKRADHP